MLEKILNFKLSANPNNISKCMPMNGSISVPNQL